MRTLLAAVFLLGACGYLAAADDDKLTEKFLLGKWSMRDVGVKTDAKVEKTIEFKPKGAYVFVDAGMKKDGTYKLKGTTIELTDKASGAVSAWKDVAIKDGKMTRPLRGKAYVELTRVEEEKKEEKKDKE